MKHITKLPREIQEIEHTQIPLSDGVKLAAKIWLPEDAVNHPVPAVLEYIPYRKRDFTAPRDAVHHAYFAGHGFAGVRVDIRGSGDSEGVLTDEYLEQELRDGEEILRWIADQPWCNGHVGIIGISWGGFNGLQLAARQPPELKAIITVASTDDRYADDVHYMGGCLLGDNLSWASTMFSYNSLPPDPQLVGDRWREMWFQRLEGSGHWLDQWLRHQRRDDYWKHGSICEDFGAVQVPVMAVSGWADGYSNAVFRLLENLSVPRRGLVGPWSHKYPHQGKPGPAIGFLQECVRWWRQWLEGDETGVMDEPMLQVWMQESVPPTASYDTRPGRWVGEAGWPTENVVPARYRLNPNQIESLKAKPVDAPLRIESPLTVGLFAGKWCSYSAVPDLPHDQRQEDGGALVFDSPPLDEELEILGAPILELDLSSNRPMGMIAVRLSDIAVDDRATRVTYGLLNLTHRNSHEHPEPMVPGERYRVQVRLNEIAQTFPAGHRIRIAISTSYWPLAWLPPESTRLTIRAGNSFLVLPVRQRHPGDQQIEEFAEPEGAPPPGRKLIKPGRHAWTVTRDLATDTSTLRVAKDDGVHLLKDIDLEVLNKVEEWYQCVGNDFTSARGETLCVRGLRRGDWRIKTVGRTVLTCTRDDFILQAELDAYEKDKRVFSKNWDITIPRDHV